MVFARYILTGCWKNLIDTLSTPLTGRMAGSSKALVFILGAEGLKEQNQRERDAICMSLDGLRKAAGLSCALGNAPRSQSTFGASDSTPDYQQMVTLRFSIIREC